MTPNSEITQGGDSAISFLNAVGPAYMTAVKWAITGGFIVIGGLIAAVLIRQLIVKLSSN